MGLFGTKTNSSDDSKDIFGRLGKEEKEGMMVNTLDAAEPAKFFWTDWKRKHDKQQWCNNG